MLLSEIPIGHPFIYRENPDVKPRLFYRMYMHCPAKFEKDFTFSCYEVINGCLNTPPVVMPATTIVEPYKFNK